MKYTLVGADGNAFYIMGYVVEAMRQEKFAEKWVKQYMDTAKANDYDNLIKVSLLQIEIVNHFVDFYDDFVATYGWVSVEKGIACEYFLSNSDDIDAFYDYLLANYLGEVEE